MSRTRVLQQGGAKHRWLVALLGVAALACSPLEPIASANPEISRLDATLTSRNFGVLRVVAEPSDITFRLPNRARVEVSIATSGGDAERLLLHRLWCPPHRPQPFYSCNSLLVFLTADEPISELEPFIVEKLGGRFEVVSPFSPSFASVVFSEPGSLMERRRRLHALPRVAEVALDQPGCVDCGLEWSNLIQAALSAVIPFDRGSPVPHDGVVHYSPGDTVTVRYQNPGGIEIVRTRVAGGGS